ncbi:MAG TPA: YhbY family RNA-binding protein [Thermoanaerobaculia bacterium]|nr:YhbY family RNA-binding protein [Thermoanaerobaculia bacterium]
MTGDLTGAQRKYLRGLAHGQGPAVRVGQKGLTRAVEREVDRALHRHELVKVKLAGDREERREQAAALARSAGAALVGTLGTIAILYRPHPDPKDRKVRLP